MNNHFLYLLIFLLSSCASVEKYNQQISKLHTPKELHEDIDLAHKKLKKLHPDLYWYISKDSLEQQFNALKNSIQQPLSSIDFYKKLAPVIASIKQGHTIVSVPLRKQTKPEKKKLGKRDYPFKPFLFQKIGNKLFIKNNYGKDSTITVGTEILSIENEPVKDLLAFLQTLRTGDGYNKTFVPLIMSTYIGNYYVRTHGQKDSVLITLKKNDSVYSKYLYAQYSKQGVTKKDTIHAVVPKVEVTKMDKKLAKKEKKKRKAREYKYDYNKYTKENGRVFKFIKIDSAHSTAYLKIKSFSNGGYKEFYKTIFTKIDSAKSENLIIDLRNNLGGQTNSIDDLYSYLIDNDYVFLDKSKMTKSMRFTYPSMHSSSWLINTGTTVLYPLLVVYAGFKVKKIDGKPYFFFKQAKPRKPKVNNYKGKIYVLINGMSFSASSIISTHLKETKRAVFVGEETGGAYNGTVSGLTAKITLKNSKVTLLTGLMNMKTPYTATPDGYGVIPDVHIIPTTLKTDEQLDWIIGDIGKTNH